MRLLLLFSILIMAAASVSAATFTAAASGDWQSTTTWGSSGSGCGVAFPCKGDQVLIGAFTVTCGLSVTETCSAGTSPANQTTLAISMTAASGALTLANGSTLIYAGPVSSVNATTFTACAGCTIQYDGSSAAAPTTANYTWKWGVGSNVTGGAAVMNLSGTIGSHVTWSGDSCLASTASATTCGASGSCLSQACLPGGVNYVSGSCPTNIGYGAWTYTDFKYIQGSPNSGANIAICSSSGTSTVIAGGISWSHITVDNSGSVRANVQGTNDANTISISSLKLTNCTSPTQSDNCARVGAGANTGFTGTYSILGMTADGAVCTMTGTEASSFTQVNVAFNTGHGGAFANQAKGYPTQGCTDGGTYDQVTVVDGAWNTGTTQTLNSFFIPLNLNHGVLWNERDLASTSTSHLVFTKAAYNTVNAASNVAQNIFFGGFGANQTASVGGGVYSNTDGTAPTSATTYKWTGNIVSCSYSGYGTGLMLGGYFNAAAASNISDTVTQNTICNVANTGGGANPSMGAAGLESVVIASGTIASIDSNLFFNLASPAIAMDGVHGPNDASASPTSITFFGGNAAVNGNPWTQQYSGNSFVATLGTDTTINNRIPVLVEALRVPTLFDTEYLFPQGLLTLGSYGTVTAWATSTAYTAGQVVSDSQAGVYGGKTTYWRCVQAHTSAATSRPVTGFDATNPYQNPSAFWEEAFWSFFRTQVLANTTYDAQCAALLFVSCGSPHTYITGLLNAWLREGYVSMESTLWSGGTGACAPNGGAKQECGAVPLPLVQHIPPAPGFAD